MADHSERQKIIREISPYMGLTSGLIATLILFGGIGWLIDDSQGTYPTWTAVLGGVGAVIAILNFIRNVIRFSNADEARKKKELEARRAAKENK